MTFYNFKTKNDLIEITFLYFSYRNLYYSGFQRYSFFRNLIVYTTGLNNYSSIRSVFNNLLNDGLFDVKKENKKIFYRFNPKQKKEPVNDNKPYIMFFE